ncbi:MAG: hypothetical protein WCI34_06385, partial [Actinomycetes bacterium]
MRAALKVISTALALLLVASGSASASDPILAAGGGLQPAFARSTPNYVTTCVGNKIKLTVRGGTAVSSKVDASASLRGALTKTISVKSGHRTIVRITDESGTSTHSIRCM